MSGSQSTDFQRGGTASREKKEKYPSLIGEASYQPETKIRYGVVLWTISLTWRRNGKSERVFHPVIKGDSKGASNTQEN